MRFGVMDFADFLTACVDTFEQHPDLLERDVEYPKFGIRAKYVLYDEVQDNSVSNNSLFRVLCGKSTIPYLGVAVGDAKQAIYGFRGACSYGFGQMIQSVQKTRPENIHHLTCSFRSLSKIVALGNECVSTLPEYKDGVHPSHTVYTEPGEIIVAPPLSDEIAEADWVLQRVRELLYDTNETVMVLHRNNLREHPIVPGLKEYAADFRGRLSVLTIHRSKGLQAHHVFLMGMTATLMPDVRTSYTQMVNLLYVGLTRPRKALYLTAPYTLLKTNTSGEIEVKEVGPSPFLYHLPSLRETAERAGWPIQMLKKGEETTESAAGNLAARIGGKEQYLRRQWRQLWPDVPIKEDEGDEYTPETGGAEPSGKVRLITRRSLYEDGKLVLNSAPRLDEGIRERVILALRKAYPKNGQAPRFSRDEYILALKAGWISRVEGSRHSEITPRFVDECAPELSLV
jgi:superfamily I DNA/RNA helicase